jgi:hypothetical protein
MNNQHQWWHSIHPRIPKVTLTTKHPQGERPMRTWQQSTCHRGDKSIIDGKASARETNSDEASAKEEAKHPPREPTMLAKPSTVG